MPEIPELQHVASVLTAHLRGRPIVDVDVGKPIVIRLPRAEFESRLMGASFTEVTRSGKFLLFHTDRDSVMAVNPMLNGRFQWINGPNGVERAHARTCFTLRFEPPSAEFGIRYIDERYLGKVYLVGRDDLGQVPVLSEQGPDALDPELDEALFLSRMRRYRGQVKNALVNARFVAGIGNAYADEILFSARIHPFAKIATLDESRRVQLFEAMRSTLDWASAQAAEEIGERIDLKPRAFLRVHRKGGQPCPACGQAITEVSPNRRITSYCRSCQPE